MGKRSERRKVLAKRVNRVKGVIAKANRDGDITADELCNWYLTIGSATVKREVPELDQLIKDVADYEYREQTLRDIGYGW